MLSVDDKAPPFALRSGEGTRVTLASLRGRKVILYFYPKDNTPGCTTEACSFQNTFVIDERGTITAIFRKVKVNGHTRDVLASL